MNSLTKVERIRLVGVGTGAGNIINRTKNRLERIDEFISISTDEDAPNASAADIKIHVGEHLESKEFTRICNAINGCDRLIVITCLGGRTGTEIAPVVAEIARKLNIKTNMIVIMPFGFEGVARSRQAEKGVEVLSSIADNLILISNEETRKNSALSFADTFAAVDYAIILAINKIVD